MHPACPSGRRATLCLFPDGPARHENRIHIGHMAQILVIDDDPAIAELLYSVLLEGGHEPEAVTSLDDFGSNGFRLVIADLLTCDTYQVEAAAAWVAEIRRRIPGVPVVVCTAHRRAALDREAIGADAVITKPFDVDDFLALVDRLTGGPAA